MDVFSWVQIIAIVVAVAVVAIALYRRDESIDVNEMIDSSLLLAKELETVGLMAVASVEQLKKTGKINTDEEAFNEAFDYISRWPGMEKLDRLIIARAVEGSYHLYKKAVTHGEAH